MFFLSDLLTSLINLMCSSFISVEISGYLQQGNSNEMSKVKTRYFFVNNNILILFEKR